MLQLARRNIKLPVELRQSIVLVEFAEPLPKPWIYEFLRIRLTRTMLDDGETEFYRAEVVQPHRLAPRPCRMCWRQLSRINLTQGVCENRGCPNWGRIVQAGPVRGVVKVGTRIRDAEGHGMDLNVRSEDSPALVNGALLCLDRRYDEPVLEGVYCAAGTICEQFGWSLK